MKYIILTIISVAAAGLMLFAQEPVSIIPLPAQLTVHKDFFSVNNNVSVQYDPKNEGLRSTAEFLQGYIENASGFRLGSNVKGSYKNILLNISSAGEPGDEGYTLEVQKNTIKISASRPAGIFYAIQSLIQTMPATRPGRAMRIPCMLVKDQPRFKWRGLMLDVSRHFFSPDDIKRLLNLMASFKMNVFHWHLCDDQGWRLEIKKYPRLTETGAWRNEKQGALFYQKDTTALTGKSVYSYGGYYTQEEVKEIVAYAAMRNIMVVPEIEMPGHSGAALAAYPEYSCSGLPQPVPNIAVSGNFDSFSSNYCPGNPDTYTFLEEIITEVAQLFPSPYIHIGGDEVNKKSWKLCPKCQSVMRHEGLKNEEALQSFFIKKIEKLIHSKGKRLVGWGEILEGGLAPDAVVMSWVGEKSGIEAANMSHEVIMCPGNPLYLNRHQTEAFEKEPHAPKYSINTLQKVYQYNPVPLLLPSDKHHFILGAQAVLWTEFIDSTNLLEYMLLPRMCALAEIVWSPYEKQNFTDFKKRLQPRLAQFKQKGIRYFSN